MTSNPMLRPSVIENTQQLDAKPMTISGAINKTLILLTIVVVCAVLSWGLCAQGLTDKANVLLIGSAIGGLVLAIITSFNPTTSNITAPAYAICEGLAVGVISYAYGAMFDGIVFQAVGITILALFTMLFLYKSKAIQATPTFRKVILISTFAIMIFYLIGFIGSLIGHPMTIFNGSLLGIGVSVAICIIAALNFVLDFDFIEQGSRNLAPSYLEWYGAFGLLVTLIWLYFEVLRLLAQLNQRD